METGGFWLCLLVLLSLIDLSQQGCRDYFSLKDRGKYADHDVSVVNTKDQKDQWECTVERECLNVMEECTKSAEKECATPVESNCTESVKNNCTKSKPPYCNWLKHCFKRKPTNVTEKCKGEVSQKLNGYHLVCLTAKRLNHPAEGCDYGPVCELFANTQPTVSVETTTLLPPTTTTNATLPETTTATEAATTTTLPDTTRATTTATATTTTTTTTLPDTTRATTTTTTTTTLPDTTRATTTATTTTTTTTTLPDTTRATTTATTTTTTTLPDTTRATTTTAATTTTTALSPTVTQSPVSGNNAHHSKIEDTKNTDPSNIALGVSVILNVIVPLAVYLYMRRRRMQDREQWMSALESNGHLPEAQPMTELRSDTPSSPPSNREEEDTHLMTCQSVVTHCADTDSNCCAAGEDTPL